MEDAMKSALQFLEEMYLPGFLSVLDLDFSGNTAWFNFMPVEPQVTILSDQYLTPRGTHISLSQSSYCFCEEIIRRKEYMELAQIRNMGTTGRLKIVEFNQRFRAETKLNQILQGKLIISRFRWGKMPVVKMDFDLNEQAIAGDLTGVIAPHPVRQTNVDILRIK